MNPVQELDADSSVLANMLTGLRIDEYFARTDSSNNQSTFLSDSLGSTIGLVGSSGMAGYTYEPFGATSVGGTPSSNSYQFTGRENDGTSLYYYRARYYSPTLQRFIAEDPLGFLGGDSDLYAYVLDNPALFVDPLGLYCLSNATINAIAGAVGGAVAGGLSASEFGPGAIVAALLGGAVGGVTGYLSSDTLGNEAGLGAVSGAATGLTGPQGGVQGGLEGGVVGGVITYGAQEAGLPDWASVTAGSTAGGAAGAVLTAFNSPTEELSAGDILAGGSVGAISGLATAAVAALLEAHNNCPCGQK